MEVWLEEQGFKLRLRLTGGRGAQIILNISMDRITKNYSTPFPRPLKFDTWIRRLGEASLGEYPSLGLVKILTLAYGCYRKSRLEMSAPLTVEMHVNCRIPAGGQLSGESVSE